MNRHAMAATVGCVVSAAMAFPSWGQAPAATLVLEQCAAELGLTEDECACTLVDARDHLSQRQIDYLLVRIARNDAEVERMRTFMPLRERLPILWTVTRSVEYCAPGKEFVLPDS